LVWSSVKNVCSAALALQPRNRDVTEMAPRFLVLRGFIPLCFAHAVLSQTHPYVRSSRRWTALLRRREREISGLRWLFINWGGDKKDMSGFATTMECRPNDAAESQEEVQAAVHAESESGYGSGSASKLYDASRFNPGLPKPVQVEPSRAVTPLSGSHSRMSHI
jgi:hypothetical protein